MKKIIVIASALFIGQAQAEERNIPLCNAIAFYIANAKISEWLPAYEQYKTRCSPEFTSDRLDKLDLTHDLD